MYEVSLEQGHLLSVLVSVAGDYCGCDPLTVSTLLDPSLVWDCVIHW